MTNVAIPDWNSLGLLPPMDPAIPAGSERSPYRVTLTDVVTRFATSPERRLILQGWLNFRSALHNMGLTEGFQWLNGSFMEHVEVLEHRPPRDTVSVKVVVPSGVPQPGPGRRPVGGLRVRGDPAPITATGVLGQ